MEECFFQLPSLDLLLSMVLMSNFTSADTAGSVLCGGVIDNCILTGLDSYTKGVDKGGGGG